MASITAPRAARTVPAMVRNRNERLGRVTSSRRAAIGGTVPARRAGNHAATIVSTTPMSRSTTTVRGWTTSPPAGMSNPMTPNSSRRPMASSTPSSSPNAPPTRPTSIASTSTETVIWRRLAPTRAQQGELPRPSRDKHAECVDDDEGPDEECDAGEDEQERRDEAEPFSDGGGGSSSTSCPVCTSTGARRAARRRSPRPASASSSWLTPSSPTACTLVQTSPPSSRS